MTNTDVQIILDSQRKYFLSGKTLPVSERKKALINLKNTIDAYEFKIVKALRADLGKSSTESYMCEIGLAKTEINHMLKNIDRYAGEKRVPTPITQFASRSFEKPVPHGNVLIMSPWNYPFLLTIEPLVDAIAAGNTAILKPSAYSPHTSAVIKELIESCFSPEYAAVVLGGRQENAFLLEMKFDYIFFTGSRAVGQLVMEKASKTLTPITLELGGKSPCIVDKTANIPLAARRIVFGKYLNCGQTCVAPDYILCDAQIKDKLISAMKKEISRQFGSEPLKNENYGKIINKKHFDRICGLIDENKVVVGNERDSENLRLSPTIMDNVLWYDAVMQEEIFGPVMPVLTYDDFSEVIPKLQALDKPLALYIFSRSKENISALKNRVNFGGGCINDTIIHLATSNLAFGGVGESGMGSYHGRRGFESFSHIKSIVDKKNFIDLPMRYQPYRNIMDKAIRIFLK